MPKVTETVKQKFPYSRESLLSAVEEVRNGQRISEIPRKYYVSESTIRARINNKYSDKKPGPSTVLTLEEEN